MRVALVVASVSLGALLATCAASGPSVRPTAAPALTSSVSRTTSAAEQGPAGPLRLEEFTPLLATPELKAAANAVEHGDFVAATRAVEAAMAARPPTAARVVSWQFLLGRLRERAGQSARRAATANEAGQSARRAATANDTDNLQAAAASYDLAARTPWPLAGYARLGAGRVLLRAGHALEALERLEQVSHDQLISREASLLIAEAAQQLGQHDRAIVELRRYLDSPDPLPAWPEAALRLARALLDATPVSPPVGRRPQTGPVDADRVTEALRAARRVLVQAANDVEIAAQARVVETRALAMLPPAKQRELAWPTPEEELARLESLVQAKRFSDAEAVALGVLRVLPKASRWSSVGCEVTVFRAKAFAGQREWGRGADLLGDVIRHCEGTDLRARALFLAGKYSDSDKRYALAVGHYQKLEEEAPHHRLADDARLRAALSYLDLGAEARFTELLTRMPDDYPNGDMTLDGLFRLAMRRVERGDWRGAVAILERGSDLAAPTEPARGHEYSGRERYFRARALAALGEPERALAEYETIVRQLPLSYYMLHAYARLHRAEPSRAARARTAAMEASAAEPFSFEHGPEFDQPGFVRALELLRVGDVELAQREIGALGLDAPSSGPRLLWGIALLYARAGSAKLSHAVARALLSDWLERWPSGDWMKAWQLAFPRPYRDIVSREAKKNGVPEPLVYAVMREESAFEPTAVSVADAYGLMQLIEPTARHYARPLGLPADPAALMRPPVNIALGCRVLGHLLRSFSENPLLAVPAYNAGPGRPRSWLKDRPHVEFDVWVELIPFGETRRYTKRVLASRAAYAFLYEPAQAEAGLMLPQKVANVTF